MTLPLENKPRDIAAEATAEVLELIEPSFPKPKPAKAHAQGWRPDLNPTQQLAFDDPAPFQLLYGPKATGKTIATGHKLVRHAYEALNGFVIIITPTIFTGAEGIWGDLLTIVLPAWKEGMGLEYTDPVLDPNTKDRIIWIRNRFGSGSKVVLKSIPHASMIQARIKGPAPTMVVVDELTECESRDYFTFITLQIGRKKIPGDTPAQYVASCNPKGKKHWVYKLFFEECIDPNTGKRDPKYSVYFVPLQENLHRLNPTYRDRLLETLKHDKIEYRRLVLGEWIDKPSGEAIFKDYFIADHHVKGDAEKRPPLRLEPLKGFPILVGYDPGPRNFSVHFIQQIATSDGKQPFIVFDELNTVGQIVPYRRVVANILRRMEYWRDRVNPNFSFEHIADEAAFNQIRGDGKFDNKVIEDLSRDPETGEPRIRLKACPKGADSVPARVRLVASLLQEDLLFISATCTKTRDMLEQLIAEKVSEGKYDAHEGFRPQRSAYIHPFDSLSYPIFYKSFVQGLPTLGEATQTKIYTLGEGSKIG